MTSFHMHQIHFSAQKVHEWAAVSGIPSRDDGYLMHCLLRAAYGDLAPSPFAVVVTGGGLKVLGYSNYDAQALRRIRDEAAEPLVSATVLAEASKEMPYSWEAGSRYDFEIRVAPTRQGTGNASAAKEHRREKGEKDAFLFAERGAERSAVYAEWFTNKMRDAAEVESCDMMAFRLSRICRRGRTPEGSRQFKTDIVVPDVVLRGTLRVSNGEAFAARLRQGVGRHKSFGLGTLLIRPPKR